MESNAQPEQNHSSTDTTGFIIAPMAAAAALDSAVFSKVNASEAVPATWEERARKAWEYYVEEPLVKNCVTAQLTQSLDQAEKEVAMAILKYRTLGSLPDNKLAALKGLEKLQAELDDIIKQLKNDQTLNFKKHTREAFMLGISQGIEELTLAALPFYADLTPAGIDKLATKVFSIVDTNALDFMAQYNLTLADDVQRELSDGIKRVILPGIVRGKGTDDIVRDLGHVVIYKDSFRQTGTRVFSKAQYRIVCVPLWFLLLVATACVVSLKQHRNEKPQNIDACFDRLYHFTRLYINYLYKKSI